MKEKESVMKLRVSMPPRGPAVSRLAVLCVAGLTLTGLPAMAAPPAPPLAAQGATLTTPLTQLRFRSTEVHLTHTVGDVKVNGQSVNAGVRLQENARISTGEDSSAVLVLADGSQTCSSARNPISC